MIKLAAWLVVFGALLALNVYIINFITSGVSRVIEALAEVLR